MHPVHRPAGQRENDILPAVFYVRRDVTVDYDLPTGDDLRQFILKKLAEAAENA